MTDIVRQHTFYIGDDAWTKIRHHCFDHGISVSTFIADTMTATVDPSFKPTPKPPKPVKPPVKPKAAKAEKPQTEAPVAITVVPETIESVLDIPRQSFNPVPKPVKAKR